MKYFLIILSSLLVTPSFVSAAPGVDTETNYYEIYGATAAQLRKEMKLSSSIVENGETFDAYTYWEVSWKTNWRPKNGNCYLTKVSTNVSVRFTLPKWMNRDGAEQNLRSKWDRYYSALIQHENAHKNFGIQAAEDIEKEILALQPNGVCGLFEKEINQISERILDHYKILNAKYDAETNNGATEGAVFP